MSEEVRKPIALTCLMLAATLLLLTISMDEYRALKAQAAVDSPLAGCAGAPTWCQITSPNVNSTPHEFKDLAVFTNTHLMAVGAYSESDAGGLLYAQEYKDGTWSFRSTASPGPYNRFNAIAATAANNVYVAGDYYSNYPNPQYTLLRRWAGGSSWSVITTTNPGTVGNGFSGISMLTPSTAWAVGAYNDGFANVSLAEYCSPTCTAQTVPSFSAENNVLTSVAAITSNNVWAVGSYVIGGSPYHRRPIVLHYTGTWTIPSYQIFTTESFLNSVDYYAANDVWMVGGYKYAPDGSFRPLVAHWDGNSLSFATDINPFGSGYTVLNRVFVTNEREVWAVGEHRNTVEATSGRIPTLGAGLLPAKYQTVAPTLPISGSQTFVMHWNGSALNEYNGPYWSKPASDSPGTGSHLLSVAAPTIRDASGKLPITSTWSVGSYINGSNPARTLVENIAAPNNVPKTSISYLINNTDTATHLDTGYCAGKNGPGGIIVLDYGAPYLVSAPNTYGTKLFDSSYTPTTTYAISLAAESFINGYHSGYNGQSPPVGASCASATPGMTQSVTIAIGTSNDNSFGAVGSPHAQAWANVIKDVKAYANRKSYSEISVVAAVDIEPAYSHPSEAQSWVSAYNNANASSVYNYGATENYPCKYPGMSLPSTLVCAGIGDEWTAESFYTVSYGIKAAFPLPEIYHNLDPLYWYQVSSWGVDAHGTTMLFAGTMTNYYYTSNLSDYSPNEGWQTLWLALNSDPRTAIPATSLSGMRLSTDIQCITKPPDPRTCAAQ